MLSLRAYKGRYLVLHVDILVCFLCVHSDIIKETFYGANIKQYLLFIIMTHLLNPGPYNSVMEFETFKLSSKLLPTWNKNKKDAPFSVRCGGDWVGSSLLGVRLVAFSGTLLPPFGFIATNLKRRDYLLNS